MKFTEWVKKETGHSWSELKAQGTTFDQRGRLYDDYKEYCKANFVEADFDFKF